MTTYGEIKRMTLELIDQHRVAGAEVPLSYNNQSDYAHRIPNLLNQALLEIRGEVPRVAHGALTEGRQERRGIVYSLPQDCRGLVSGGVWRMDDGTAHRTNNYMLLGRDSIVIPFGGAEEEYMVEYYAAAPQVPADPPDGYEVDEAPDVIAAAAYYAAAHLVMMEDEFLYAALSNEYETRLQRMRPPMTAEIHTIDDGFGGCWAWPG